MPTPDSHVRSDEQSSTSSSSEDAGEEECCGRGSGGGGGGSLSESEGLPGFLLRALIVLRAYRMWSARSTEQKPESGELTS